MSITLSILNEFSNVFVTTLWKICDKTIIKNPNTHKKRRYSLHCLPCNIQESPANEMGTRDSSACRPGSRLEKSTWGRLERSKSVQVTFVYRQVGFVWHRLFRVKSTSQQKNMCHVPDVVHLVYFFKPFTKIAISPFSSNTDYQIRLVVHLWKSMSLLSARTKYCIQYLLEHRDFFGRACQWCADRGIYRP